MSEKKLLGHVDVDSGQLFITDPCYLEDWKHGDIVDNKEKNTFVLSEQTNDYGKVCAITVNDETPFGEINGGVAFGSFGGDGSFPVYGHFEGRNLTSIEIVFNEVEDEDEDSWEDYDDGWGESEDEDEGEE